jgi:hypothetical protein
MQRLTDLHIKLINLDRKKEEVKKFFEEYQSTIKDLVQICGISHHFQDECGIVYQLVELEGRYVNFDRYGLERTKRPGEDRGSLSIKKAKELGYDVN